MARLGAESFLAILFTQDLNLGGYLEDAAEELAGDKDRATILRAEMQEAEAGLRRLADAVAAGALDIDAAKVKTLELREKKERAENRLGAMNSGVQLGEELRGALALVQEDLATVLHQMERSRFKELIQLIFRRISVEGRGGTRKRTGETVSWEFSPEFQEFWLTHSKDMVGLVGR